MQRVLFSIACLSPLVAFSVGLKHIASAEEKDDPKAKLQAIQKQIEGLRQQIDDLRQQEQALVKQLEQAKVEQDEFSKAQGKWELVYMSERAKPPRWMKEIKGNKESVWVLGDTGEVAYRHHAEIRLEKSGNVKLFTYSNKVVEDLRGGPGTEMKGGTYIYRVDDQTFAEVHAFLTGVYDPQAQDVEPAKPSMLIWRRVRE